MANLLLEQFETRARVYDDLYEMPDVLSPMYAEGRNDNNDMPEMDNPMESTNSSRSDEMTSEDGDTDDRI